MLKPPKELSDLGKSQLENTLRFAEMSLASTERITRLQMEAARRALEENVEIARALTAVKDPQELISLRAKLSARSSERMLEYSKEIYEAAMQSRAELLDLVNEKLAGFGKDGLDGFADLAGFKPAGLCEQTHVIA